MRFQKLLPLLFKILQKFQLIIVLVEHDQIFLLDRLVYLLIQIELLVDHILLHVRIIGRRYHLVRPQTRILFGHSLLLILVHQGFALFSGEFMILPGSAAVLFPPSALDRLSLLLLKVYRQRY